MSTFIRSPEHDPASTALPSPHATGSGGLSRQIVCVVALVITDLAAIALSLELAIFARTHLMPRMDSRVHPQTLPFENYVAIGWVWLLFLLFLSVEGLYTQRRSIWNEVGHLTKAIGLGLVAVLAAVTLKQLGSLVSRPTVLLMALILCIVLPVVRLWTKWILGKLGLWSKRILILGAADVAKLAVKGLTTDPVLGYEVVGLLDDDPNKKGQCVGRSGGKQIFVLGNLSEIWNQMDRTAAKDVLIAMPGFPEEKLLALVHELQPHCESIYIVPQLWGMPMMNLQVDGFLSERVMMLKLSNNLAKPWNSWLKRCCDLILGAALAIIVLPLCLAIAFLVKLDSDGTALFVQERLGFRGGRFRCLKFRTMHATGEKALAEYLECNPDAADEWRRFAKLRTYDPRLTRVGRFLRRWSLDELPQFLNVLKGDMSLVGPRPYLPQERDRIGVDLPIILSARPGITGFWQVNGRNHLSFEDRVEVEAWYVRNWTVWLDCIVFAKTFRAVLFPKQSLNPPDECFPEPTSPRMSSQLASTPFVVKRPNE